ncbi:RNA polymerase sigma factor [compost metagenome]
MTRLLLPLEHPTPAAEQHAEDALLYALKRLPRRVQQVLLLNRLDQLDFASIAARLDLSLASIERHMNQALQAGRSRRDVLANVAGQWYVRLQSPQVTACERIDFRRWLDADPENLQAFHETELRWRSLLAPARQLGHDGWYRQGRAALSLGGCSVAVGLGVAALVLFGFWV